MPTLRNPVRISTAAAAVAALLLADLLVVLPATLAAVKAAAPAVAAGQSAQAEKAPVASVAASSPQVKSALAATDVAKASALNGKTASVQATITKAYSPASGKLVILDLAKDYHDAIAAVAFSANFSKLPDLQKLVGQHVLLTGPVTLYKGKPEMQLTSASQIKIIK